jgi:glutathione S-transferase
MKLYDVQGSPNCRKVRVLARELGLSLELVPVSFADTKRPEWRDGLRSRPAWRD